MPRKPRLHVPGGFYHVILRGNHREPLFGTDRDRAYLNALVGDVVARFGLRILAYCWMTNHLHLAVRVGVTPLDQPMQRLAMRYSRHIHRDAGQVGHLFERRYRAILVDADSYLKSLVRYIHLNPVVAGMVPEPMAYRWSSHRDYLGQRTVSWLETDFVLGMFGPAVGVARVRYARFMRSYVEEDLALFEKHESRDTRGLEPELPAVALAPPVGVPGERETLEQIAARHCARLGISMTELVSPSRARRLSSARTGIVLEALEAGAGTVSEISRFLGRSPSALAQQLTKLRSGTF
ncbi:MAG: transposase [Gammaproteobacteria bacterium]|nr:transposase [Gammaproteobacteria bacterium]